MPTYKAPVDDALFLLNDVFHLDRYGNLPGFADATPDMVEAVLREAGQVQRGSHHPAQSRRRRGRLHPPPRWQRHDADRLQGSFKQLVEGGWIGISAPAEFGGQDLPATLTVAVNEMLCSANQAFAMYPGLTQGAIAALLAHASQELKTKYLPKMVSGEWTGTMNLTEPHCGTDLGLLRTKAVKQADGSYKITGTKIFISAGEHDLSRQHRPSGAGAHRRRARRHQGYLAVRGAEADGQGRRLARRAQWRLLRLDRREDGHPRQFDVRDELRRRHRLAGRRGEPRPAGHVHHDERGPSRRRRAGPGAIGSRLSERRDLRQGAPARPRAHRRQISRQAGRPDHRASGYSAHADDHPRLQRGRRARWCCGPRCRATSLAVPRTASSARAPTITWGCSPRW